MKKIAVVLLLLAGVGIIIWGLYPTLIPQLISRNQPTPEATAPVADNCMASPLYKHNLELFPATIRSGINFDLYVVYEWVGGNPYMSLANKFPLGGQISNPIPASEVLIFENLPQTDTPWVALMRGTNGTGISCYPNTTPWGINTFFTDMAYGTWYEVHVPAGTVLHVTGTTK